MRRAGWWRWRPTREARYQVEAQMAASAAAGVRDTWRDLAEIGRDPRQHPLFLEELRWRARTRREAARALENARRPPRRLAVPGLRPLLALLLVLALAACGAVPPPPCQQPVGVTLIWQAWLLAAVVLALAVAWWMRREVRRG